ncbi:hemagglutinin repeat-containing protein, partial [Histophilus somni]|uniref:hemagglutinin repeat-containing protein n=1 Tax=Histophilus somni TaxID=731 RepID=UPI0010491662
MQRGVNGNLRTERWCGSRYESSTYHNSHLDAEHIKFNSQGDITLNGTTATAERIDVNAKGDLRIESKQDSN